MVDAITERSGFLSVQPRAPQAGEGARSDSNAVTSLPVIQFSPTRVSFDPDLNRVFFQFRDTETGEVTSEVPPRTASRAFEATAEAAERQQQERPSVFNFNDDESAPGLTEFPTAAPTGVTGTPSEAQSAVQPTANQAAAAQTPSTGSSEGSVAQSDSGPATRRSLEA